MCTGLFKAWLCQIISLEREPAKPTWAMLPGSVTVCSESCIVRVGVSVFVRALSDLFVVASAHVAAAAGG